MLRNFFKLDGQPRAIPTQEEFLRHFKTSRDLRNAFYEPAELSGDPRGLGFRDLTFHNVSFSKTKMFRVSFVRCRFSDCLFIGTEFNECEFEETSFACCNPYKARFRRTRISPSAFLASLDKRSHSNIGTGLYAELLRNYRDDGQESRAADASYLFRKWRRYQLVYKWRKRETSLARFLRLWISDVLFQAVGYSVHLSNLLVTSGAVLGLLLVVNFLLWSTLGLSTPAGAHSQASLVKSLYFTVCTMATIGFGDIVPSTTAGYVVVSLEGLVGVVWIGAIVSLVVRRLTR